MNTVFPPVFRPAVWLRDNHLSDCGRRAYSPAVRLHSDHLLHKPSPHLPSAFPPLLLLISQPFSPTPPSCLLLEVVIHQTATSVRCQLALMNDSDERMLNERGKWESWVIIRKALFSARCCLLFILPRGSGQSVSNWRVEQVEKASLFFKWCRIKTQNVVLFLLASLVSHSNSFFFPFLFCPQLSEGLFSVFKLHFIPVDNSSNHPLPPSIASAGCPAVRRRQPEESAGEGEAGSVSHATLHPSRLSEPPPWHDRSGRHQKTNGQFH